MLLVDLFFLEGKEEVTTTYWKGGGLSVCWRGRRALVRAFSFFLRRREG